MAQQAHDVTNRTGMIKGLDQYSLTVDCVTRRVVSSLQKSAWYYCEYVQTMTFVVLILLVYLYFKILERTKMKNYIKTSSEKKISDFSIPNMYEYLAYK